jgi:hypothetical protein
MPWYAGRPSASRASVVPALYEPPWVRNSGALMNASMRRWIWPVSSESSSMRRVWRVVARRDTTWSRAEVGRRRTPSSDATVKSQASTRSSAGMPAVARPSRTRGEALPRAIEQRVFDVGVVEQRLEAGRDRQRAAALGLEALADRDRVVMARGEPRRGTDVERLAARGLGGGDVELGEVRDALAGGEIEQHGGAGRAEAVGEVILIDEVGAVDAAGEHRDDRGGGREAVGLVPRRGIDRVPVGVGEQPADRDRQAHAGGRGGVGDLVDRRRPRLHAVAAAERVALVGDVEPGRAAVVAAAGADAEEREDGKRCQRAHGANYIGRRPQREGYSAASSRAIARDRLDRAAASRRRCPSSLQKIRGAAASFARNARRPARYAARGTWPYSIATAAS